MFRVRLAGRLAGEELKEICFLALGATGADVERIPTMLALRAPREPLARACRPPPVARGR